MEKNYNKQRDDMNLMWKLGFMLLLGIILGIWMGKGVLAFDTTKWQICSAINLSGGACDDYWNTFLGQYGITGTINTSSLEGSYYNITQIDKKLTNLSDSLGVGLNNESRAAILEAITENISGVYLTKEEQMKFRESLLCDKLDEGSINSSSGVNDNIMYYVIIVLIVLVICYFLFKDKFTGGDRGYQNRGRYEFNRIQKRRPSDYDDDSSARNYRLPQHPPQRPPQPTQRPVRREQPPQDYQQQEYQGHEQEEDQQDREEYQEPPKKEKTVYKTRRYV